MSLYQSILVLLFSLVLLLVGRFFLLVYMARWEFLEPLRKSFKTSSLFLSFALALYLTLRLSELPREYGRFVDLSEKLIEGALILAISFFLANLSVELLKRHITKAGLSLPPTGLMFNVIKALIILLGILTILSSYGIPVVHFITTLGVGALAVSLALQSTLSNFFSGLNILAGGQIRIGDYVVLESGQEGYVEDITWMNTVIRTRQNVLIIVPNSKITTSVVQNYSRPEPEVLVVVPVGVSYREDLERVERITVEVAKEVQKVVEGADPDFEPFIRYTSFGESSINFNAVLRAKHSDAQFTIRHEFIKRLKRRYEEETIEIPFPQRVVYIRDARAPESS